VLVDRTSMMSSKEHRTLDTATALVVAVETFINAIADYVGDRRKVINDVDFVMESIDDFGKRLVYAARLLAALTSYSDVRFDVEAPPATTNSGRADAFRRVGRHILEKWIPVTSMETVLTGYVDIVGKAVVKSAKPKQKGEKATMGEESG
jgi:hypothetical protein